MTDVDFHCNVVDRLGCGCRLLRKGVGVTVTVPTSTLYDFDRMFQTFADTDFIAHILVTAAVAVPPHLQATSVWLVDQSEVGEHLPVLLNPGDQQADGFGSFERLIAIISTDPERPLPTPLMSPEPASSAGPASQLPLRHSLTRP